MFKVPSNYDFIKFTLILQILCTYFVSAEVIEKTNPESSSGVSQNLSLSRGSQQMIACADKRAAFAAEKVLEDGGNALDAAIAAQNVLSVVEPQSSGIGGGGFLLFYNNKTKEIEAWDGREFAPSSAKKEMFFRKNGERMSFLEAVSSDSSIGIPGLYAMLADAHAKRGFIRWEKLFEDAINLTLGFKVSNRLSYMLNWAPHLNKDSYAQELYFNQGKAKKKGELIINKKLNKSLIEISNNPYSLINGNLANKIVNKLNNKITLDDLKSWKTFVRKPICNKYLEYNICGFPPPTSGGIGVLQILGILENFKEEEIKMKPFLKEHLFLESSRLAYSDRDVYIADPNFFRVPVKELLSKSYLTHRSKEIIMNKANKKVRPGNLQSLNSYKFIKTKSYEKKSTTHISIIDKFGNAVSLTSSIEFAFGSGITVGGFFLNNQLTDFSFSNVKKHNGTVANSIGRFKKPRSSMAPTIVFKNNAVTGIIGSPGGSRIICYVAKSLFYLINEYSIEEVLSMPHFCSRNHITEIEKDMNTKKLEKKLAALGHDIIKKKMTSGLNIIWKKNNVWYGGSDPRREGVSIGY